MKKITRLTNESVDDLVKTLEAKGIAPKGRILHIGPSDAVKNIAGNNINSLPNLISNGLSISSVFTNKKES